MKEIKLFLDEFVNVEKHANYLRLKPNLNEYNDAYEKMNTFLIKALSGQMGLLKLEKLEPEKFYKDYEDSEPFNSRKIFKVSRYTHTKYGDVWVAYVSEINPYDDFKMMGEAFFVIRENDNFLIAKQYMYSNYSSDGYEYTWSSLQGYNNLTFNSLDKFISTERYEEPIDDEDSMKMYLEEK